MKNARFLFGESGAGLSLSANSRKESIPRDNFLHARLPPHRDLARFELLTPQQALRRRFTAGQLAQTVRAHRPPLDFHQRKQRQLRDFGFAAISARIQFAAARATRIGHQKFALVPQIDLRRQHRAKHFPERRHIVAAHPAPKLQKFRRQRRNRVQHFDNFPYIFYALGIGPPDRTASTTTPVIARLRNGTSTRLPAHTDPASRCGNFIREQRAQRNRQRDFAISGRHVSRTGFSLSGFKSSQPQRKARQAEACPTGKLSSF